MDAAHRPSFGEEHFGACDLGDRRLTRRAVVTADALMRHPGGTLPAKLPRAELRGFYGLANNPRVAHATLLAAHCARTRDAMAACPGVVPVIHDTTEADFGGLDVPDLGPIGNGGRRGLLLHNVLAVDYANREAIGLAGQFVHRRRTVRKGEGQAAKRRHPQRESRLWVRGAEAVGRPPAGATWVNLMDRGGDTFEGLARQVELGASTSSSAAGRTATSRCATRAATGAGPSCTATPGGCRRWARAPWPSPPATTGGRRARRRSASPAGRSASRPRPGGAASTRTRRSTGRSSTCWSSARPRASRRSSGSCCATCRPQRSPTRAGGSTGTRAGRRSRSTTRR